MIVYTTQYTRLNRKWCFPHGNLSIVFSFTNIGWQQISGTPAQAKPRFIKWQVELHSFIAAAYKTYTDAGRAKTGHSPRRPNSERHSRKIAIYKLAPQTCPPPTGQTLFPLLVEPPRGAGTRYGPFLKRPLMIISTNAGSY